RFDGGIEVKAHDVAGLLHEQRIRGEFERLLAMRLQTKGSPDPADRRLRQAHLIGHAARAPMRRVLGRRFQRSDDYRFHLFVFDRARLTRSWCVRQPVKAHCDEAITPLRNRLWRHGKAFSHSVVLRAPRTFQSNARAKRQSLRSLTTTRPRLQLLALVVAQNQLSLWPASHRPLPNLSTLYVRQERRSLIPRTFDSVH